MKSVEVNRQAVGVGQAQHDVWAADVETSSDDYARRFAGPVGEWMLDVQAAGAVELLSLLTDGSDAPLTVLDLGGGHGQLTSPLLERGHRVISHGSTSECHRRLRENGARVGYVTSSMWSLPFADDSFDVVVALRLLAHVEEAPRLFQEAARVARRGVLVDFPARSALHRLAPWLFVAKRSLEGNTRPYFDYELREIRSAIHAAGWALGGVCRQFAFPMVLHRSLRLPAISRLLERFAAASGLTRCAGSPVLALAVPTGAHS